MGYNTTVVIYNDCLDMIKDDPEFGKNLSEAISRVGCCGKHETLYARGERCYGNVGLVIEAHHADETVCVSVGQNYGSIIKKKHYEYTI